LPTGPLTNTGSPAVQGPTLKVAAPSVDAPQGSSLSNPIETVNATGAFGNGAPITTSNGGWRAGG
jgi:hypothetical protein